MTSLVQPALFGDVEPEAPTPADPTPADPADPAGQARPAPFPRPDRPVGIAIAAVRADPARWAGRLIHTSIAMTSGYTGSPGWYRFVGVELTCGGGPEGMPVVAATVTDTTGAAWLSRWLPAGSISVAATTAEWAESVAPLPDEAPDYRIHPRYYERTHHEAFDQEGC